jgi:anti-sigma B factor antagonist
MDFTAEVASSGPGSDIRLKGTVNGAAKGPLEAAYETAAGSPGEIILDFSQVDYINSTGIAVIVGVMAMARAGNRDIGARGLSDHYREVFEITRLADFMNIYEDSAEGRGR